MERLNKFLAHAGIGSRRRCEEHILAGRVAVDGKVTRDLATKIDPEQHKVTVNRQEVKAEHHVYWLVNKPRGYLCTNYDPQKRPLAVDLLPARVKQRAYPVGRLDEQSEGLLLLTNDGDLANRLMHPRFGVEKTYMVQVAGEPKRDELQQLLDGVWLSDGRVRAKRLKRIRRQGDSTWLLIVLNEGKNREIRRMLAKLEHKVLQLKRVAIGPIRIGRLGRGKARPLKPAEVQILRRISDPDNEIADTSPTRKRGAGLKTRRAENPTRKRVADRNPTRKRGTGPKNRAEENPTRKRGTGPKNRSDENPKRKRGTKRPPARPKNRFRRKK